MNEQPVLTQGAIVSAISAVLMALVALGVVNLSNEQLQAIVAAVAAVLVVAAPIVGALWARNRTVPTSVLQSDDGKPVTPASVRGGQRVSVNPAQVHKER